MTAILPETGFLGFFDILGYTQIMLNKIHVTAQFVSDTLVNIPHDIIRGLRHEHKAGQGSAEGDASQTWESMLDKIKWIIFSDSILVSMPLNMMAIPTTCCSIMLLLPPCAPPRLIAPSRQGFLARGDLGGRVLHRGPLFCRPADHQRLCTCTGAGTERLRAGRSKPAR